MRRPERQPVQSVEWGGPSRTFIWRGNSCLLAMIPFAKIILAPGARISIGLEMVVISSGADC